MPCPSCLGWSQLLGSLRTEQLCYDESLGFPLQTKSI